MKSVLSRLEKYRVILSNAVSLMGTAVVTSGLGFLYWWIAARRFSPDAVGFGSAAISSMLFIGNVSMLGFGTLLIGELPRRSGREGSLISTALLVVGMTGGVLGLLFAIAAPEISDNLQELAENAGTVSLFALGVSITAVALVLDQALVGLLRGDLQLWRNSVFAVVKLFGLFIAGLWLSGKVGFAIYEAWLIGNVASFAALLGYVFVKNKRSVSMQPEWGLLRKLGSVALSHHALNLTLQTAGLMMPVLVTTLLSARMNAYFYTAWMISNFATLAPVALTSVLYAVGSADPAALADKLKFTLRASMLIGASISLTLFMSAKLVLGLFASEYAEQASLTLRILSFAVFPIIIRNHFMTIRRIRGQVAATALWMLGGTLLELSLAATGAIVGGLSGLSVGWIVAISIEALLMARTLYNVIVPVPSPVPD